MTLYSPRPPGAELCVYSDSLPVSVMDVGVMDVSVPEILLAQLPIPKPKRRRVEMSVGGGGAGGGAGHQRSSPTSFTPRRHHVRCPPPPKGSTARISAAGRRRGDEELISFKLAHGGGGGGAAAVKLTLPSLIIQYLLFTVALKHERVLVSLSAGRLHYETTRPRRLISGRNLNWRNLPLIDSLIFCEVAIRYK